MKKRYANGFTLVEMMVEMAIGAVVLLLGTAMLGSAGDGYARLSGGVSGEREARALMSQLAEDLATARWHADTLVLHGTGDWAADRIGFLTLQAPDAQSDAGRIGDLCAVRYYIKDMSSGGRVARCLMRGMCESNDTLSAVRDGAVSGLFVPSDRDEAVAFGVVAFEVKPKTRNYAGLLEDWQRTSGAPPDAVEVRLVVARREAMVRLATAQDWDGVTEQAKKMLGDPSSPQNNPLLAVYGGVFHFGNEACR